MCVSLCISRLQSRSFHGISFVGRTCETHDVCGRRAAATPPRNSRDTTRGHYNYNVSASRTGTPRWNYLEYRTGCRRRQFQSHQFPPSYHSPCYCCRIMLLLSWNNNIIIVALCHNTMFRWLLNIKVDYFV